MELNELKGCAFCGGIPHAEIAYLQQEFRIYCTNCSAEMRLHFDDASVGSRIPFTKAKQIMDELTEQWNERCDEEIDGETIVRCADCKRWTPDGGYGEDLDGTKRRYGVCSATNFSHKENHFCSYGERKKK